MDTKFLRASGISVTHHRHPQAPGSPHRKTDLTAGPGISLRDALSRGQRNETAMRITSGNQPSTSRHPARPTAASRKRSAAAGSGNSKPSQCLMHCLAHSEMRRHRELPPEADPWCPTTVRIAKPMVVSNAKTRRPGQRNETMTRITRPRRSRAPAEVAGKTCRLKSRPPRLHLAQHPNETAARPAAPTPPPAIPPGSPGRHRPHHLTRRRAISPNIETRRL